MEITPIRRAIESYVEANVASASIVWEGDLSTPPLPITKVQLRFSNARASTIGVGGDDRIDGTLMFTIHTERGKGTGEANEIMDELLGLFNGGSYLDLSNGRRLTFSTPIPGNAEEHVDGTMRSSVDCPWYVFNRR